MSPLLTRAPAALLAVALLGYPLAAAADYPDDMRKAFQAVQAADYSRARELLDRNVPAKDAADPRGWEWYHLQALCREPALSFRGHALGVSALAWSPDGKRLATAGDDGSVKVWDPAAEKEVFALGGGNKEAVKALAWSPGGKQLVVATAAGTLRGWDAGSGKELFSLAGQGRLRGGPVSLAWAPDGKRIAWTAGDDTLRICDVTTGKEALAVKSHAGSVFVAAWSPDGKRLASAGLTKFGGQESEVKVWDASTGKELMTSPEIAAREQALAWSPDGKRLASASPEGKRPPSAGSGPGANNIVRLWDAETWKETDRLTVWLGLQVGSYRLTWDAAGDRLTLTTAKSLTAWDPAGGKMKESIRTVMDELSPDGRHLSATSWDGRTWTLKLSDARTGQRVATLGAFTSPEGMAHLADGSLALAWSPDGRRVAAGGTDGTVRIWPTQVAAERSLPVPNVAAPAWAPDGRKVVLVDAGMSVRFWDVTTGKQTKLLPGADASRLGLTAWAPDGRRLAASYADGTIRVWNFKPGAEPLVLPPVPSATGTAKALLSLLWSADGKRLAAFTSDGGARVFDAAKGEVLCSIPSDVLVALVRAAALSPDGKRLARVTEAFGPIKVFDIESGKPPLTLRLSQTGVGGIAWSPDGKQLAGLSQFAEALKVWDAATGKEVCSVEQDRRGGTAIFALAWSPDGKRLAATQMGDGFKVLEVATKKELLAVKGGQILGGFAWSPDGKRLATLDRDLNKVVVKGWDAETGKQVFTLTDDTSRRPFVPLDWLSWSPDGRSIAAPAATWDIATGKTLFTLDGPKDRVFWDKAGPRTALLKGNPFAGEWRATSGKETRDIASSWSGAGVLPSAAAWTRDARRVAFPRGGGFAVADVAARRLVLSVGAQPSAPLGLAWDAGEKRLAGVLADGSLRIWDVGTGQTLLKVAGQGRPPLANGKPAAVAFSPDGNRLAAAGKERTAKVWDAATGRELLALRSHEGGVLAVAWSPDGKRLATGSDDATVKLWDAASGKETATLRGHREGVHSLAWSPDGRRLASVGSDRGATENPGTLKLWDAATGEEVATWLRQAGPVSWSPDGRRLASVAGAFTESAVVVWEGSRPDDKPTPEKPEKPAGKGTEPLVVGELRTFSGHTGHVTSVALSADGRRAVSGSFDKTVRLWDVETGKELKRLDGHTDVIWTVAISSDGKRALSAGQDRAVRLWDVGAGKELKRLEGHEGIVSSVAFLPGGRQALSASWDKTARLWDLEAGKELKRFDLGAPGTAVAIAADGKQALFGSNDGALRLWDVEAGKELKRLPCPKEIIEGVAFSPDGKQAAAAHADKTVRLYDLAGGKEVRRFEGHTDKVDSVSFSADGRRLLSAGADKTIRLWDVGSGRELFCFEGHRDKVRGVVWAADGRRALSGSFDRTLKLWGLPR